jgi:hypothetical protein
MRSRIFRYISTIASLLLLVAVPTQASPVRFADVVNIMGDVQRGQTEQLRLRATQDPTTPVNSRNRSSSATDTTANPANDADVVAASNDVTTTENSSNTSLVAGTDVAAQQPQGQVTVFDQDQVNGTICDCGEIPAVGGGFPKWPFLLLIPLVCVTGICTHDHKKPPQPEETPTPSVPEPTSLLLLGSGIAALSAGARRRYAKMRASKEAETMLEV